MPQPPRLTPEQRQQALQRAAEARRRRAEIKELLSTGSLTIHELLVRAEEDELIAGMKVAAALKSLPGLGKVKAGRLMEELDIDGNRRIRGLGDRQRERLLDALS